MYTNTKTNTRQDKIRKQRQVGMSWIREGFSFAANESPKSKNKSWLDPSKWALHSVIAFATLFPFTWITLHCKTCSTSNINVLYLHLFVCFTKTFLLTTRNTLFTEICRRKEISAVASTPKPYGHLFPIISFICITSFTSRIWPSSKLWMLKVGNFWDKSCIIWNMPIQSSLLKYWTAPVLHVFQLV